MLLITLKPPAGLLHAGKGGNIILDFFSELVKVSLRHGYEDVERIFLVAALSYGSHSFICGALVGIYCLFSPPPPPPGFSPVISST